MDTETFADIREAARLARECAVTKHALALARWVSAEHRQVTAGQVPRKADFAGAGELLGVEIPPRTRWMTDIKGLSRPWRVAVSTGLLSVEKGWASAGPSLGSWPPDSDADVLDGWLAGLRDVCAMVTGFGAATVKTHLLHIYAKLGVSDRAAAVAEAYNRGLLTPGSR